MAGAGVSYLDIQTSYRKYRAKAEKEGDVVTAGLFSDILADEEERHNQFARLLKD